MGPFAVEGSMTWLAWVISIRFSATRRRAAWRVSSRCSRHESGQILRVTSLGQIDAPELFSDKSFRMVVSRISADFPSLVLRQASEQ